MTQTVERRPAPRRAGTGGMTAEECAIVNAELRALLARLTDLDRRLARVEERGRTAVAA